MFDHFSSLIVVVLCLFLVILSLFMVVYLNRVIFWSIIGNFFYCLKSFCVYLRHGEFFVSCSVSLMIFVFIFGRSLFMNLFICFWPYLTCLFVLYRFYGHFFII